MNIGIRAHDFGKLTVEKLADKITEKGFASIQLALAKAIDGINTESGCLSPGLAKYIRQTFDKRNINISVLGCYINPIHPDLEERRRQIERFKEHIRYARDFGCSIVGTETGSINANCSYHPDNAGEAAFEMLLVSVGKLVREAEKFGVFVGIEAVTSHVISTPERMKRLLDTINSNNLQVIFDPVNLLSEENYREQEELIHKSFDLFGDRIVAIHAKDFIMEEGIKKSAQIGKGVFNYELLVNLLKERKPYIDILFEDTKVETMEESLKFIKNL